MAASTMVVGKGVRSGSDARWGLRRSRLQPPLLRPTDVQRRALLDRLSDPRLRLISVVAPPGYGKTTLLAEYAQRSTGPSAWLSIDDDCNDPIVLARYLALALEPFAPIGTELQRELEAVNPRVSRLAAGLGAAIGRVRSSFLLVIDDLHELTDPSGAELIEALVDEAPSGTQVALAGQRTAHFLGRARAAGGVLEIGTNHLAFGLGDAELLLQRAGAQEISGSDVTAIMEQTEGWPVGLYLAALSRRDTDRSSDSVSEPFHGDDRLVADFFRETVLARLPSEISEFLIRTAVLDVLSGTLCDTVLETTGSGAYLEELEDENLFVVPLDRRRERYRYHHLFRDWLLMELRHRAPDLVPRLTARASAWCEQQGSLDRAITYAMAGNDVDRVATLVGQHGQVLYYSGRAASLARWFDWISAHAPIESYPVVAVLATWFMAMEGRPVDADRWAAAAASGSQTQPLAPDLEGARLLAKAAMCREGVEAMAADAELATSMLQPASPWIPTASVLLGLSSMMRGDIDAAIARFEDCLGYATQLGTSLAASVGLSELAVCSLHRGDVAGAETSVLRARDTIDRGNLKGYFASALTLSIAARVALVQGDHVRASRFLEEASASRSKLTEAVPMLAIQTHLELARCSIGLGDVPGAQAYLAEADLIARRRPGLGVLIDELRELEVELDARMTSVPGMSSLTPAEARLLPLLTTHLSFREIGERLFLSPHTIKTHAISIYRKLGVTSRAAAVETARHLGLLSS